MVALPGSTASPSLENILAPISPMVDWIDWADIEKARVGFFCFQDGKKDREDLEEV